MPPEDFDLRVSPESGASRDAPHGLHADYRPMVRKVAAEDDWKRCLAWLRAHGAA